MQCTFVGLFMTGYSIKILPKYSRTWWYGQVLRNHLDWIFPNWFFRNQVQINRGKENLVTALYWMSEIYWRTLWRPPGKDTYMRRVFPCASFIQLSNSKSKMVKQPILGICASLNLHIFFYVIMDFSELEFHNIYATS